jgi:hypothetical protein
LVVGFTESPISIQSTLGTQQSKTNPQSALPIPNPQSVDPQSPIRSPQSNYQRRGRLRIADGGVRIDGLRTEDWDCGVLIVVANRRLLTAD